MYWVFWSTNNPTREVLAFSSFYRWKNQGTERLPNGELGAEPWFKSQALHLCTICFHQLKGHLGRFSQVYNRDNWEGQEHSATRETLTKGSLPRDWSLRSTCADMDHKQRVPFWTKPRIISLLTWASDSLFTMDSLWLTLLEDTLLKISAAYVLAEYNIKVRNTSNPIWIFIYCLDNPLFCLKNSPWYTWI